MNVICEAGSQALELPPTNINSSIEFNAARQLFEELVNWLSSDSSCGLEHSELESKLQINGNEILKRLLQGYLNRRSEDEIEGECAGSDGAKRTHKRKQSRKLTTIFGTVTVSRIGYGGRKITSLNPLDAELNLPEEQYSHGVRERVAASMRRRATYLQLTTEQRSPVDKCANYLLNHRDYLHYHHYLASGFPIATGVIEGACRYLIKDRMDITGARWSLEGAEAVLRLRSLLVSGDWNDYWRFHLSMEHQRHHRARYQSEIPLLKSVLHARCPTTSPPTGMIL